MIFAEEGVINQNSEINYKSIKCLKLVYMARGDIENKQGLEIRKDVTSFIELIVLFFVFEKRISKIINNQIFILL